MGWMWTKGQIPIDIHTIEMVNWADARGVQQRINCFGIKILWKFFGDIVPERSSLGICIWLRPFDCATRDHKRMIIKATVARSAGPPSWSSCSPYAYAYADGMLPSLICDHIVLKLIGDQNHNVLSLSLSPPLPPPSQRSYFLSFILLDVDNSVQQYRFVRYYRR